MNKTSRALAMGALSLAALLTATGARAQAEDWQHVATACTPQTANALGMAQFNVAGGFIRANNPNAGTLHYTCNVLDSYATFVPVWNWLTLQYRDTVGGRVQATLYSKNKVTGATVAMANVVGPAAGGVNNVSVALPALNFAVNGYFVVLSIASSANNPPQAHMVQLQQ
jgi:hypothetical protein